MKNLLSIILLLFFTCNNLNAQNVPKEFDTYNYKRAVEEIENENYEGAKEYLNKELEENPKNAYASTLLAMAYFKEQDYAASLSLINQSIKIIPRKNKDFKAFAYLIAADIYKYLEEYEKAIDNYDMAIEECPDEAETYEKRADLLYRIGEYDLSDKDYKASIELANGNYLAYMGLGRNAMEQKKYDAAIEYFNYVEKLAKDYSSVYSFRGECYFLKKEYIKAIDDVIKALSIDGDDKAFFLMVDLAEHAKTELITKLKVASTKSKDSSYWPFCIGVVYETTNNYKEAISYYIESNDIENSPDVTYRIGRCFEDMGEYEKALDYINFTLQIDSTDNSFVFTKADLLYEIGKTDEAILELDKVISVRPEFYYGYYRRGFYKDNNNDTDGAIEDYTTSIVLEPSYAYAYLGRADKYKQKGEKELAESDYRKVIELDTIPDDDACAHYAYFEIGDTLKAKDFMLRVIENNPDDPSSYYDAACLFSRIGEMDKSIDYLEESLKKGYKRFKHIENDDDLKQIIKTEEYRRLIEKYKNENADNEAETSYNFNIKTLDIPYKKDGDLYIVNCKVNNLPLHFIFDTGASDISISDVEANFMYKNNYLNNNDFLGKRDYITADGSISEGTIINIRNVDIGGLELKNVRASVVKNQRAPLLLGQSVLNRLGKIEIDNDKKIIKVTYSSND